MADAVTRLFAPPGDLLALTSKEPLLFELAERLWEPAPGGDTGNAIAIEVVRAPPHPGDFREYREDEDLLEREDEDFLEGAGREAAEASGSPRGTAGNTFTFEERLRWVHEPAEFRCEVPGVLEVDNRPRTRASRRAHRALSSSSLFKEIPLFSLSPSSSSLPLPLSKKSPSFSLFSSKSPSFFSSSLMSFLARTLLEAPAAVLLARRGWRALHAGAVAGPKGAVVVRGGSGAGKSTLVAAAFAAGLDVLGDESLFVSRADPDYLSSSVRELTLREDSAALVGLLSRTRAAFSGGEEKRRVDLFPSSRPAARAARRVSTLLLGPRVPGPARLVPLSPPDFLEEFAKGEIPQEQLDGGAGAIARGWADAGGARLDGASDLRGAVALLKGLVT